MKKDRLKKIASGRGCCLGGQMSLGLGGFRFVALPNLAELKGRGQVTRRGVSLFPYVLLEPPVFFFCAWDQRLHLYLIELVPAGSTVLKLRSGKPPISKQSFGLAVSK